jgi:hypothetical protein
VKCLFALAAAIMNNQLYTLKATALNALAEMNPEESVAAIESGKIIYLPDYYFSLAPSETDLLSESVLNTKQKNISYDFKSNQLSGLASPQTALSMTAFMHRFAEYAKQLVDTLFPQYIADVVWGRTSYRPAEIDGRKTSPRKDDTRLHVDSFSATPVHGLRILRVFCNINPVGKARVWEVGEPFAEVLKQFAQIIPSYSPFRAKILHLLKATKTCRSPYDHYMLNLHDQMKLSHSYQQSVMKHRVEFPAQSTWVVFTDQVSHAALGGQYLLEQTFYLPVVAMSSPELSPLKQWESVLGDVKLTAQL